ncbi:MAG: filamentous hemagglutinin N-terminal domain-containing protein, partial [Candidatus Omnitrophota bacterium]|nr:filamentous hemagglutinin N-terminal domain-containing protein [Candidatus Omnitrophota bacterium]
MKKDSSKEDGYYTLKAMRHLLGAHVIPAKAGIQTSVGGWMPAFAGMTLFPPFTDRLPLKRLLIGLLSMAIFVFFPTSHGVFALPEQGEVVSGEAEFHYVDSATLKINASHKAIINYKSFDIRQNESVIITLPDIKAEILNRVIGSAASQLLGSLTSNGIFFLVNPNGISVGENAQIQTGGLILSTRDITDSNFLNSKYIFEKMSKDQLDMLLLNKGQINITDGGFGVLIAGAVENQGTIVCPVGTIATAAGDLVKLDIAGEGMISIAIDKSTADSVYDYAGKPVTDQIKNTGTMQANGGIVILKAEALPGIFEKAINLEGCVKAEKLEGKNGKIILASSSKIAINAEVKADEIIVIGKEAGMAADEITMQNGALIAQESVQAAAEKINIKSFAPLTEIYKPTAINLISSKLDGDLINLEGEDFKVVYLKTNSITLETDNAINTVPGVIIQGNQVKVFAKQFGTLDAPLKIEANTTYINRRQGDIGILESTGLGTSIMLRGPPDGFGAIIYNQGTNLILEAEKNILSGTNPAYLYGNITFYNFECTISDKEIYFEPGKTYTFKGPTYIKGSPDIYPEEYLIKLRSQKPGQAWYLNMDTSTYFLDLLNVSDCYTLKPVFIPTGVNAGGNFNLDIDPVWDNGAATGLWSTPANWVGDIAPTGTDVVTFNNTSSANCVIDNVGAWSGGTFTIEVTYIGTITQNVAITTGAFSIAAGTYNSNGYSLVASTYSQTGGTFTAGASNITCSNNWLKTAGTFNAETSTVIFDATTTGKTITDGGSNWYNVTFNGTGGGWSFVDSTVITSDMIVTAGTLSGTQDITVQGGDITGNGTINLTGGTCLLDGAGNFGGDTNWTFYNLTFGDGTGLTTTTKTGANQITTTNVLTIAANQTL